MILGICLNFTGYGSILMISVENKNFKFYLEPEPTYYIVHKRFPETGKLRKHTSRAVRNVSSVLFKTEIFGFQTFEKA